MDSFTVDWASNASLVELPDKTFGGCVQDDQANFDYVFAC